MKTSIRLLLGMLMIVGVITANAQINRVLVISPDSTSGYNVTDAVQVAHSSRFTTNQFTLEAWVFNTRKHDPNLQMYILSKGVDNTAGSINFHMRGSDPNVVLVGNVQNLDGKGCVKELGMTVTTGVWMHVAWVHDAVSGIDATYLNGELLTTTNGIAGTPSGTDFLFIGAHRTYPGGGAPSPTFSYSWHGYIDEVRFWNKPLPQSTIASNMNRTLLGSESGLVGYWNFDDATANDSTTNLNHGTFVGSATTSVMDVPWALAVGFRFSAVDITWNATIGKTYQPQWTASMMGSWSNLGGTVVATSSFMYVVEWIRDLSDRSYRVVEITP